MRMRRKANLDARLKGCQDTGRLIVLDCEDRNFVTSIEKKEYLELEGLFGNDRPIVMEIGCGKGQFACELAKRNPGINVLAVEKTSNVIVDAAEKAIAMGIENLYLLRCDAAYLSKFIPPDSVSRLYLNFSCPFPKKSYASHRLTHRSFLEIYKELLKDGAELHQKTDDRKLFEFSVEELSYSGFRLKNISLDLHADSPEDNIMTEYEKRFVDMGLAIYRLEAVYSRELSV